MELINCGEQTVNKRFRIPLTKICKDHGIKEGDRIEVFIRKPEKIFFCGENKLCITDSCTKGKELKKLPATSVPVKSRIPSPDDPEWENHNIWEVNEPIRDERETYLEFVDGSKRTLIGRVELVRGCENKL
jgi:bifunctional DNA-binding transcriptional regulator/antitoxin component of YhaV-PrlF toxin-antitoxin module